MMLTFWSCNPEQAMYDQLARDCDREWLEWQREQDDDEDELLAAEFMEDPDAAEWPWWLDLPYEVQQPQVFGP